MSKQEPESPAPITIAGISKSLSPISPTVLALLGVIQKQAAEIQIWRDEIQRLKKTHRFDGDHQTESIAPCRFRTRRRRWHQEKNVRLGETKENQDALRIDVDESFARRMPPDAKFEGYRDFIVSRKISSWSLRQTKLPPGVYRSSDGILIVRPAPNGA